MPSRRRFRGMGHGRKTRRELSRGGTGVAQRLNETLGQWKGVRITPMFGRWGYFFGEDTYQYMAVYEFQDEPTFRRFLESPELKALVADYDAEFGGLSERARFAYAQVWP